MRIARETAGLGWLHYLVRHFGETRSMSQQQAEACVREEIELVQIYNQTLDKLEELKRAIDFQRDVAERHARQHTREQIDVAVAFNVRGGAAPLDYPPLLVLIEEVAKTRRPSRAMRESWERRAKDLGTPWAYIQEQARDNHERQST